MKWGKNILFFLLIALSSCSSYRIDQVKQYEKKKDTASLVKILKRSPDPYVQTQTAYSLGRLGDQKAVDPLIEALDSPSWELRFYSVQSLEKLGNRKAVLPLEKRLEVEEERNVRNAIQKALKNLSASKSVILP